MQAANAKSLSNITRAERRDEYEFATTCASDCQALRCNKCKRLASVVMPSKQARGLQKGVCVFQPLAKLSRVTSKLVTARQFECRLCNTSRGGAQGSISSSPAVEQSLPRHLQLNKVPNETYAEMSDHAPSSGNLRPGLARHRRQPRWTLCPRDVPRCGWPRDEHEV